MTRHPRIIYGPPTPEPYFIHVSDVDYLLVSSTSYLGVTCPWTVHHPRIRYRLFTYIVHELCTSRLLPDRASPRNPEHEAPLGPRGTGSNEV